MGQNPTLEPFIQWFIRLAQQRARHPNNLWHYGEAGAGLYSERLEVA
jgi:hypothetical protein